MCTFDAVLHSVLFKHICLHIDMQLVDRIQTNVLLPTPTHQLSCRMHTQQQQQQVSNQHSDVIFYKSYALEVFLPSFFFVLQNVCIHFQGEKVVVIISLMPKFVTFLIASYSRLTFATSRCCYKVKYGHCPQILLL